MADIFISYSRKDGDFAEILRSRLKEQGFTSWIDLEGLRAGEEWRQEIDQEIRDSLAVVVILTANSRHSEYVAYEWAFAIGAGVRVIPILLEPVVLPPRLATVQHLDFIDRESRPWKSLFEALKAAEAAGSAQSVRVSRTAPIVVREAVKALDSADSAEMEKAVLRLAEMQIPEAEEALVGALKHPLPDVRIASAWQLAKRGDARAVPGLIEGNRRRGWHMEFARKIREIGRAALPGLRPMLTDPQPWMRRDAIWAIQEVGGSEAAGDLAERLGDDEKEVVRAAVRAMGALGDSAGIQAVAPMVIDGRREVREAALQALVSMGGPSSVETLVRCAAGMDFEKLLGVMEAIHSIDGADVYQGRFRLAPKLIEQARPLIELAVWGSLGDQYATATRLAKVLRGVPTPDAERVCSLLDKATGMHGG